MSQQGGDSGNEHGGGDETRRSQPPEFSPSYDLFGNPLMPAAPDSKQSSSANQPFSSPSSSSGAAGTTPNMVQGGQSAKAGVSPITYVIAGLASVAILGFLCFFAFRSQIDGMFSGASKPKVQKFKQLTIAKDLPPQQIYKLCSPSLMIMHMSYMGKKVGNTHGDLVNREGDAVPIYQDDKGNTFFENGSKHANHALCYLVLKGKKFAMDLTVVNQHLVLTAVDDDNHPVPDKTGHPITVTDGFTLSKWAEGATGSGFFVQPDIVATNCHVATGQHAPEAFEEGYCEITDKAGKYFISGKALIVDPDHDLALFYVPGTDALPMTLHTDYKDLNVGDPVYAMGSPIGYAGSFTSGIIAADRLRSYDMAHPDDGERFMIQHSAKIDHGNSGGPLVNTKGEVVGVNTLGAGAIFLAVAAYKIEDLLNTPSVIAQIEKIRANAEGDLGSEKAPAAKDATEDTPKSK